MKTLALCAFALMACAAPAAPVLVYDAAACVPGINCTIGGHGSSPGSGPANSDFQTFFSAQFGIDLSGDSFTWTTASNANGDAFGHVDDTDFGIHTAYLWNGSAVLCCTLDDPYAIADGNDHDHFIGEDLYGVSNSGQPLFPAFLAGPGGPEAMAPLDYALSPEATALIGDIWWSVRFVAIANDDTILATWGGPTGWLIFTPGGAAPSVPEPVSILLLVPALAAMRRRLRRG
jgi:hypothetical protein